MKKRFSIVMILAAAIMLGGCSGGFADGKEVGERAFVQLLALERNDGIYTASMQIYKSESGSAEPDVSKANSFSSDGKGSTVQAALADAETALGKKLFLGHIKLLVIGRGIENPADEISLFLDGNVSPACPVVYSDDPNGIANALSEEGLFSAEQITAVMENAASQGKAVYTSVSKLCADTGVLDCAAALPAVSAEDKEVTFGGLTLTKKNGAAGIIPAEDVLGAKILLNDFSGGDKITVPVNIGGKPASAFITGAKTKLEAYFSGEELRTAADVRLKLYICENPYDIDETLIEKAVCEEICGVCARAYSEAVQLNSCDIFGIKKLIRRNAPERYERYCGNADAYLAESVFDVRVSSRIVS